MSEPFSVLEAAQAAPGAPALTFGAQTLTYAALAARVRERIDALRDVGGGRAPYPLVAAPTLANLVTLYALFELRVPILLVDDRLALPEREALFARARRGDPLPDTDAAVVIHTSGTTGEARGAVLTRAALAASAAASAANLGWRDDDCWLACMPFARIGGLAILTRCLAARRHAVVTSGFDAGRLPEWIARHRATLLSLVPTMLARVLDAHPDWQPPAHLRAILVGGAAAPAALLRRAAERDLPIVLTYGLTETCSQVVATPYADRYRASDRGTGTPLPGAQVRVVAGRIEVRGPMLMAGYWDEAPRDRDAWFDTGDLGEIDAHGCLHVHARRVDLVLTGGDNVYPAEVERALEAIPGIAAAGVFGVPDAIRGQTVAAALVAGKVPPTDAELEAWIGARLAPHKRPRRICFVARLPQTAQGKLDRNALQRLAPSLRPLEAGTVLRG